MDRQTSNKLFRLYCSVKKSEALSALNFQRRERTGSRTRAPVVVKGLFERRWRPHHRGLENNSHLLGPLSPPIFILGSKSVCQMAAEKISASAQMPKPIPGWKTVVSQPNAGSKITLQKMLPYGR